MQLWLLGRDIFVEYMNIYIHIYIYIYVVVGVCMAKSTEQLLQHLSLSS